MGGGDPAYFMYNNNLFEPFDDAAALNVFFLEKHAEVTLYSMCPKKFSDLAGTIFYCSNMVMINV